MGSILSLNRFNLGLFSEKLSGSTAYPTSLKQAKNVLVELTGPAKKRGGFKYKLTNNDPALLFPFIYNNDESCLIVISQRGIKVYNPLTNTFTWEYTPAPWGENIDPTKINIFQSQDVVYICSPEFAPYKLIRLNKQFTSWALNAINFVDGPYLPENETNITISCGTECKDGTTAEGTVVTLTSSTIPNTPANTATLNSLKNRKLRLMTISGTSNAWASFEITSGTVTVNGDNTVHATYSAKYELGTCYANYASKIWRRGAFGTGDYPTCCCIHEGRLCFAEGKYVYLSKTDAFETFSLTDAAGAVQPTNSIAVSLNMKQSSRVKWMMSDRSLILGCDSAEYVVKADDYGTALTPTNITSQMQTSNGSEFLPAFSNADGVIFVKKFGKKIAYEAYNATNYRYTSMDLSSYNEELLEDGIIDLTFASDPIPTLWLVTSEGKLISQTLDIGNEVYAFTEMDTQGTVLSVTAIPNSDTGTSDLYALIRRKNGTFLEVMDPGITGSMTDTSEVYFSDSCKKVTSDTKTTHFTGFSHLAGQEVVILADGAIQPPVTVNNDGSIDIQYLANTVIAGLGYEMVLQPSPVGVENIVIDAAKKNISTVSVRLYKSVGLKCGYDKDHMYTVPFRNTNDRMDEPLPLVTGLLTIPFRTCWNSEGGMVFVSDQPLPFELLQLIFNLTISG